MRNEWKHYGAIERSDVVHAAIKLCSHQPCKSSIITQSSIMWTNNPTFVLLERRDLLSFLYSAVCFFKFIFHPLGHKQPLRYLKCSFRLLSCITHRSCGKRGERCELHQARLPQSEPLIITSQYQLQQPCTDAKTLRGLATLPYLIWAGGSETAPHHHPLQSGASMAAQSPLGSNHSGKLLSHMA